MTVRMYVCMYVCVYVRMYVCMYVCTRTLLRNLISSSIEMRISKIFNLIAYLLEVSCQQKSAFASIFQTLEYGTLPTRRLLKQLQPLRVHVSRVHRSGCVHLAHANQRGTWRGARGVLTCNGSAASRPVPPSLLRRDAHTLIAPICC